MNAADCSLFLPTFLQRLADPSVKTVLLCGCGGGFDFVHSLILVPELRRLGKSVVIGSYSFGDPESIGGQAEVVFQEGDCLVKRVCSASIPDRHTDPKCTSVRSWIPNSPTIRPMRSMPTMPAYLPFPR